MDDDRYILVGQEMPDSIWGQRCWEGSIISQNKNDKYYWITIGIFGLDQSYHGNSRDIIILPGTAEYEDLNELVKFKNNDSIKEYANLLAIKYLPPSEVYSLIKKVGKSKYFEGVKDTQRRIKEALGMYEVI